ncbi:MAG: diadenylate cyclase [Myxococcota bacterium]|nr:diadenylate cyclase [Myxococcota bacterium]
MPGLEALPFVLTDLADLTLVWLLVWAGVAWLRRTPARVALVGLAVVAAVFLVAKQLGLVLTTWILQGFFAVSVLVIVVVFQQELRRLFEQIASLRPFGRRLERSGVDAIDVLVRSLATLADQRRGALVVLPGHEPLDRHLDGGVLLDACLSEPLLLSLFDPHSPGHDGAIVIEKDRVVRFAVHLPLSSNHAQLGQRGTRHAAGLGLSERADALCVIVSEERGTVSIARAGRLETLPSAQLAADRIRGFEAERDPSTDSRGRLAAGLLRHWREAALAVPLAAALWALAVPGSSEAETELAVPIEITGLPKEYVLEKVEPPSATVRLGGRRRDLLLLDRNQIDVRVDVLLVELGRRSFRLSPENVRHPEGLELRSVEPATVKIDLRQASSPGTRPPAP